MTDRKSPDIQLEALYYFTKDYCTPQRFSSYSYQFAEVMDCCAERILEIGPGAGVVTYLLRKAGRRVDTLDHDPELKPDIVASLLDIPVADDAYDAVLCCQVLEHLPWEKFPIALAELKRVTKSHIILSLPHISKKFFVDFKLPKLRRRTWSIDIPLKREMYFDGEHYWEIGRGVTEKELIKYITSEGLKVKKSYRPPEFPYHHFYTLD